MKNIYQIKRKTILGKEVLVNLSSYKDVIEYLSVLMGTTEMLEELYLSIKDIGEVKVSELLNKNNKFMDYRNDYKVSKSEIIERTRNLAKLCKWDYRSYLEQPYIKDICGYMDYVSIPCFCNTKECEFMALTMMVDILEESDEVVYTILYDDFSDNENNGTMYCDDESWELKDEWFLKYELDKIFLNHIYEAIDEYYRCGKSRKKHPYLSSLKEENFK